MRFGFNSTYFAPDPQVRLDPEVRLEEPEDSEAARSIDQGVAAALAKETSPEVLTIVYSFNPCPKASQKKADRSFIASSLFSFPGAVQDEASESPLSVPILLQLL